MGKRIFIVILTLILIGIGSYTAYSIYDSRRQDAEALSEYAEYTGSKYITIDLTKELYKQPEDTDTTEDSLYANYIGISDDINWLAFKQANSECIGVISIPAIQLWYPMVINNEKDPNHYLNYTYANKLNKNGAIFLDYNFKRDFSDNHAIVFGHNMKNDSMFGMLESLILNSDKYDDVLIYIYQENQVLVYKVYAAYYTPKDSEAYYTVLPGSTYNEYYELACENALYKDVDDTVTDAYNNRSNLLTLSTCHKENHTSFTIVNAILVERVEKQ